LNALKVVFLGNNPICTPQLSAALAEHCFSVTTATSIDDLRQTAAHHTIAALILRSHDPGELLSAFYAAMSAGAFGDIPLIITAVSAKELTLARGRGHLADEYFVEPVDAGEFVSCVRECATRVGIVLGDLAGDPNNGRVMLRGAELNLTPGDSRVFLFLMRRPGTAFSRHQITQGVWGESASVDERTIDVAIGRIRDCLRHKVAVDPIRTVRGFGYAFDEGYAAAKTQPKRGSRMKSAR
jgi:DNA-binding response OmpR family regulator